jgi:hypothetical protein
MPAAATAKLPRRFSGLSRWCIRMARRPSVRGLDGASAFDGDYVDYHRFVVTDFKIDNTRSIHEDTLHLSHSVHADDDNVVCPTLSLVMTSSAELQRWGPWTPPPASSAGPAQVSVH